MSKLIAIVYPDMVSAMLVTEMNDELKKNHRIEIGDERILVKNMKGILTMFEVDSLRQSDGNPDDLWGCLSAQLLPRPIRLPHSGAQTGTNPGCHSQLRLNNGFIDGLNRVMSKGTSTLFIQLHAASVESVIKDLAYYGGTALYTSISFLGKVGFKVAIDGSIQKAAPV